MSIEQFASDVQAKYGSGIATEHSYRPELETLMTAIGGTDAQAINEPKRSGGNAPDFFVARDLITIGFIEAKDLDKNLNVIEKDEQLLRYRSAYRNLLLTNHLEFRWYVDGDLTDSVTIGTLEGKKIRFDAEAYPKLDSILRRYYETIAPTIYKPEDLAERMAKLARELARLIEEALENPIEGSDLPAKKEAVEQVLIPNMTNRQFADMFAQTIAYGLFAARARFTGKPENFTLEKAFFELPKTNPFLKKLFQNLASELDKRVKHMADLIAQLLAYAKGLDDVIANFGHSTKRQDPVIHFYETFLSAYDPSQREKRGVYYTPEPVVSYIVRSVDHILKTTFGRAEGLADEETLILDPATGTGTFLYQVIQHIHDSMAGNMGMWKSYVQKNLLPRIFGFELLMAPYTVAHMKLSLLLGELGYDFSQDDRLGIYLTNTLEDNVKQPTLRFAEYMSDEANAATEIKSKKDIMVVLGNPPYSGHSANKGEWITKLHRDYYFVDGQPLGERNSKWLQNDYVKFIRFGQWRIEETGSGILAFITDNSYLDSVTFRGMRQSLMKTFTDIYILDLHGNSKKKEKAPDGTADINVFDITQGVSIVFFVKEADKKEIATVHHLDIFGKRQAKYDWLQQNVIDSTDWNELKPLSPYYFFIPRDNSMKPEYEKGWKITDAMQENNIGIVTGQDKKTIGFNRLETERLAKKLNVSIDKIETILYRLFDTRHITYDTNVITRNRYQTMRHMLDENLAIITTRQQSQQGLWRQIHVTDKIIESSYLSNKTREINSVFPLYLYPDAEELEKTSKSKEVDAMTDFLNEAENEMQWQLSAKGRRPNLNPELIAEMSAKLGLAFITEGCGDLLTPPPAPPQNIREGGNVGGSQNTREGGNVGGSQNIRQGGNVDKNSPPNDLGGDGAPASEGGQKAQHELGGDSTSASEGGQMAQPEGWVHTHTMPEQYRETKQFSREMRSNPTPAEDLLWQRLRKRQVYDTKFRRQHTVGPFIVDFFAAQARIVIEVDGVIHENQVEYDAERQAYLEGLGLRVLRFTNGQVIQEIDAVIERIGEEVLTPPPAPPQNTREGGNVGGSQNTRQGGNSEVSAITGTFGPEDVFHYAYAVFHSPSYRERYAEFLKIDFPRLPLTSDLALFRTLCEKGAELVKWHLMTHPDITKTNVNFPIEGSDEVAARHPRYEEETQRVYINSTQYFTNVPHAVWDFHIGGYQVLHKWLKDRKGRKLDAKDMKHYGRVVKALLSTMTLMDEIDEAIPSFPIV